MHWFRRLMVVGLALTVLGAGAVAGVLWHSGYRIYVLHTGSMEPTYPTGSIVIDRPGRDGYKVGDVITFRHSENTDDVVTHRVFKIRPDGLINTKGDGNRTPDVWNIRPDQVKGSVVFGVKDAGYALVFFRQPTGVAALGVAIFGIMLLWGIFFPETASETDTSEAGEVEPEATDAEPRKRLRGRHAAAVS